MGARVLITAQSSALAGVERRLLQEVQVLRSLGATVVAAPSRFARGGDFRRSLREAGADVIEWHPYKFIERQQPRFPFPQLSGLARGAVARARLDLAHVAMPWTTVGLSRVLALADAGVPVVLGLHCTYDRARWPAALTPFLVRALRGVVGGYAVSQCVKTSFLENFGDWVDPDSIAVVPNGVDTSRFVADAANGLRVRARWGIAAEAPLLVFCGRLDPFKNPGFALDAFEQLMAAAPQAQLLMAGDGPLADTLRQRIAASDGLRRRVHLVGYVDDVEGLFQAADIYLSTSSSHEGFPLAPSEALASGLPILVPESPVFREAFGHCAVATLVPGQDVGRWSDALVAAIRAVDPARRAQARTFAEQHLTQDRMLQRLAALYRQWLQ